MMDHYKVLGVHKDASKAEIKEAFRRLALKFHPDKHSQSPTPIQHNASLQFKQLSEAYNVLVDETKRADYNYRTFGGFGGGSTSTTNAGYTYYYNNRPRRTSYAPNGGNWDYDINVVFRVLTRRGFLLNLAFASMLIGGAVIIERSGEALWNMQNSGKSFEEAMNSIHKTKRKKEES